MIDALTFVGWIALSAGMTVIVLPRLIAFARLMNFL